MHGDGDPASLPADCAARARHMRQAGHRLRHVAHRGAADAWDHPPCGLEQRLMVPRPDGAGRVATVPWPPLSAMSAAQVAGVFSTAPAAPP